MAALTEVITPGTTNNNITTITTNLGFLGAVGGAGLAGRSVWLLQGMGTKLETVLALQKQDHNTLTLLVKFVQKQGIELDMVSTMKGLLVKNTVHPAKVCVSMFVCVLGIWTGQEVERGRPQRACIKHRPGVERQVYSR